MDIEEIRKKKLEELKKREEAKQEIPEEQKEKLLSIARSVCTEKAYDRLTNLIIKPEVFSKALEFCVASFRRTNRKVEDELLLRFLRTMSKMSHKETKIEFRRK